jgi:hypothetical protein
VEWTLSADSKRLARKFISSPQNAAGRCRGFTKLRILPYNSSRTALAQSDLAIEPVPVSSTLGLLTAMFSERSAVHFGHIPLSGLRVPHKRIP